MVKSTKKEVAEVSEQEVKETTNSKKGSSTKGGKSGSKTSSKVAKSKTSKAVSNNKLSKSKATGKKSDKKKKENYRFFKMIDPKTGKSTGRYTGDTPKQAASKGFTKMLQKLNIDGKAAKGKFTIYLRESTRGSARKVYVYVAQRKKLDEPQELIIPDAKTGKDKKITYNYRNKIRKVAVPEQEGGLFKAAKKSGAKKTGKGSKVATKKPTATKKPASKNSKPSSKAKSGSKSNTKSAKGKPNKKSNSVSAKASN